MRVLTTIWLLVFVSTQSYGQQAPAVQEIDLERFIERLFQIQADDIDYDDLYESLLQLYTNPLNINQASREQLLSLYLLTPRQASDILSHIEQNGKLISIYELQSIPSLDMNTIEAMLPFITVEETTDGRSLLKRIATEPNKYLFLRGSRTLQSERGFRENSYIGDQNLFYGRFRISRKGDFSLGMTFEKDRGEQVVFDENQKGFDFYSAHVMLENIGPVRKVIVGDFQAQYGQGLVYGAGFGVGKGAETITTVRRTTTGFRPYTSALESGFFRGVGVTTSLGRFETALYYSHLKQDANIISDSTYSDFDEFVNSIQSSGLHRTLSERSARDRISETSMGGAVHYHISRDWNVGVTSIYSSFSRPLQRRPNNYNQYEFQGDENYVGSVYFSGTWQNFNLFGEGAVSKSGGTALVTGLIASLTPQIDFSYLHRNYARDFHTFYGNGFGEGSRVINEIGNYWGIRIRPWPKHELSFYYDRFKFPWLRFQVEAPSDGIEYLGRWTYRPSRSITLFAQFRQENKELTVQPEGSNLNILSTGRKRNYLANLDYKVNKDLSLKTRVQFSDFLLNDEKTRGFLILQDINYSFWKFKLSGRIALVDTDDFANAQYVFEKNVLYAFSVRGLSGVGTRRYLLVQFKPNRRLTFWARIAESRFRDAETLTTGRSGSGLNEVIGDTLTEVVLQGRLKF